MLKKSVVVFFILASCFALNYQSGTAQESDEIWDFTFGQITRISKDSITILEFDFDNDTEKETSYNVNEQTEFININALSSLRIGDEIEIDYLEENGVRIVKVIVKEDKSLEDAELEEMPERLDKHVKK